MLLGYTHSGKSEVAVILKMPTISMCLAQTWFDGFSVPLQLVNRSRYTRVVNWHQVFQPLSTSSSSCGRANRIHPVVISKQSNVYLVFRELTMWAQLFKQYVEPMVMLHMHVYQPHGSIMAPFNLHIFLFCISKAQS